MTTLGTQDPEHGAGPLLGSRYRLETPPAADQDVPVLVHGTDEVSAGAVTLLLLPESSSMLERLALRSQVRRFTEIEHPAVARVIDVLDARPSLAVVLPHAPDARLLADGGGLPADGVTQLAGALRAVHALGRAHGALDEHAVLVLPDSTVQLLPLPPEAAALPEEDLRALEALALRSASGSASGGATGIPTQRTVRSQPDPLAQPPADSVPSGGATRFAPPRASARRSWESGGRRAAIIVAGACGGAVLADLISRLVS